MKFEKDPKFSFIVPIYKVPKDVLKRCLRSVTDQDYPDYEVICVFDGEDPDLATVVAPYLKDTRCKVKALTIAHAGACAARNAGFAASTGEIVSFFNSDYIAKPGMVRLWVDALKDNPDCGFAYGAYEFTSPQRWVYPSKPFDAWLLEVANYIDCGFPLWRKYVVDWDPNCKSLQDWDFWLRVVKTHQVKGHFLGREISFLAEPPRPGGLSHDSGSNWIERVRYVKEKNGITEPALVVTSLGAPNHGKEIAKMLGADFRDDTIMKPNEYKGLYMIGFYMKPSDKSNQHPHILAHYNHGTKRIVHFVGADIYWLRKFPHEMLKYLSGALNLKCDRILCENGQALKELDELGIRAEIQPIPPYNDYELKPLPETFRVAIYLTDRSDFDKYCQAETLSIVRAMPDVEFSAYGDAAKGLTYPNLKLYGNLSKEEWKQFVYDHSCYLRIVRHDTRPMASDEFMLAGRDVVTNVPAYRMHVVSTAGQAERNEWDIFQTGLNPLYWPDTKKRFIQEIRTVRESPSQKIPCTWRAGQTMADIAREAYSIELDRAAYVRKIKEFAGVR
jgi:glycosyltransferase involved in cell wall biosynthesis